MKKKTTVGRKHALTERQRQQIVRLKEEGNLSLSQLAGKYGVSPMTIHRAIKKSQGTASEPEACDDATNHLQAMCQNKHPRIYSSYG
jgi:DNA invertase Pin-like site-specific DNA recombinase